MNPKVLSVLIVQLRYQYKNMRAKRRIKFRLPVLIFPNQSFLRMSFVKLSQTMRKRWQLWNDYFTWLNFRFGEERNLLRKGDWKTLQLANLYTAYEWWSAVYIDRTRELNLISFLHFNCTRNIILSCYKVQQLHGLDPFAWYVIALPCCFPSFLGRNHPLRIKSLLYHNEFWSK